MERQRSVTLTEQLSVFFIYFVRLKTAKARQSKKAPTFKNKLSRSHWQYFWALLSGGVSSSEDAGCMGKMAGKKKANVNPLNEN